MFEPPTTQYAKVGDLHIAFQVVGDGPLDLVFVPGWVSNVELGWEEPRQAAFLRGLASFARLILFDKRGTGLSDPVPIDRPPTLEDRMADVNAVMDAANVDRGALFGFSEGGAMSALFGATYPDRISSLVLWGATPRVSWADDWPWGVTRSEGIAQLKSVESGQFNEHFGLDFFVPGVAAEPDMVRWWNRTSRLSASPGMYVALIKTNGATDVRSVLPTISVPTLILHRSDDTVVDVRASRYMAEHIPGARLIELPGGDHWPWIGDSDTALGEIQQFLVGSRPQPQIDRLLTTVLFTDIVDSTVRADELGDKAWTKLRDIQCAMSLLEKARDHGLELRAGLHTGEAERRGDDIAGMAVHIAARVSALAGANEVLVTSTVRDLVAGSGVRFEDRERITLKGVPGEWLLLAVSG